MLQLHRQDASLDRVQAAVIAFDLVIVLAILAMVAEHADFLRQLGIVGGYRAGFSAGPEVLARIEAEGCGPAHGAGFSPTAFFNKRSLTVAARYGVATGEILSSVG